MTLYNVWVAIVADDGQLDITYHKTEGDAWGEILDAWEDRLSEDINVTEIRKRIDAMSDDDKDEIQYELADTSIDVKVEEHTIDSDLLRAQP